MSADPLGSTGVLLLLGFSEARQLEESIAQSRLQSRLEQADAAMFTEIFWKGNK